MDVLVRSIDPELWARFKACAAIERKTMGTLLQEIIAAYVAQRESIKRDT